MFGTVDRRGHPLQHEDGAPEAGAGDAGTGAAPVTVGPVSIPEAPEEELAEAARRSRSSGLELVDLRQLEIDPSAADAIPVAIARRHGVAAIGRRFGQPLVAVSTPDDPLALDDIFLATGGDVLVVVAPKCQVDACVEALYPLAAASVPPVALAPVNLDLPFPATYGVEDVDWYRVGAVSRANVRPDPGPLPPEPLNESSFDVSPAGPLLAVPQHAGPPLAALGEGVSTPGVEEGGRGCEETDLAARRTTVVGNGPERSPMADLDHIPAMDDDAPIAEFVNLVLRQALNDGGSSVHIEPSATELVVRCRIGGVLQQLKTASKAIHESVATRLKVMAGLDVGEHGVPQDGRFSVSTSNRQADVRLATLPTVHGEKIVLRILEKPTAPRRLDQLGFLPSVLERYERAVRRPAGMLLVSGPTGSGTSTTLHATLAALNAPERNLVAVEGSVEFQVAGVNHVQVNPTGGLTFADALRTVLRSDPDVLLVGELNERETAMLAIEAALTGRLVIGSLHASDAASVPNRLVEMGVEPFLVGSALNGVLDQRLVRVLCTSCAQAFEPSPEDLRAASWDDAALEVGQTPAFRQARGCPACGGTGYWGRTALQEVLLVDEEIERAILARLPGEHVARLAIERGMTTLRHDGLRKAALGITSLEEIATAVA